MIEIENIGKIDRRAIEKSREIKRRNSQSSMEKIAGKLSEKVRSFI